MHSPVDGQGHSHQVFDYEILPPSPREFGRIHLKLDQSQSEFTRRGGWGVRSSRLSCAKARAFMFGEMLN